MVAPTILPQYHNRKQPLIIQHMVAQQIAEALLKANAVKVKTDPPFTWASGIISPVYCDNRLLISYPDARKLIVEGFKAIMKEKNLKPDVIAGTATAAIPWAAFVAYDLGLPMAYIRPEPKGHGAGKQIEGLIKEGQKVLIIEDLISTGGSSIKAATAVKNECKGVVTDILAIVTWELPAANVAFSDAGITLTTLTDFTHIIGTAAKTGAIKPEEEAKVLEFKKDPPGWGKQMGFASRN